MKTTDYLNAPYHITLIRDDAEDASGWVANVNELPGCIAQGDTQEDALANLRDVMESWIEFVLEQGKEIPPPAPETTHSGRILLRLPASLHERIAWEADREGVSLNQFLLGVSAASVGWRQQSPTPLPVVPQRASKAR
jgi:antitoxin HicB